MRRKLTPTENENSELPEITGQQMKFVEGIVAGLSASDAYRAAYNCTNSQDNTIWANASRLRNDTRIAAWVRAARLAGLGGSVVTLEGHLAELERLKQLSEGSGNMGAAVQAEQLRGKASGHYTDQIRDVTDREPTDIMAELKALLAHSPELVHKLTSDDQPTTEH